MDKGGSVSPNVRPHVCSPSRKETTLPCGERAAALETALQLADEATQI